MGKTNKYAEYIVSVAALLLLIAAGALLPGMLAEGKDRALLGQVMSERLDEAEMADYVNISMVEKVGMLGQTSGTLLVPLSSGAVYHQESVQAQFTEEFAKLYALGLFPRPTADEGDSFRATVALYIQYDEPAINTIVWEISARAGSLTGVFYLDDQTGKILGFSFSDSGFDGQVYGAGVVSTWAAYLGADVRNVKKAEAPDADAAQGGRSAAEVEPVAEAQYQFELYAGARIVGGILSSLAEGGASAANRWSLQYAQINTERIITGE